MDRTNQSIVSAMTFVIVGLLSVGMALTVMKDSDVKFAFVMFGGVMLVSGVFQLAILHKNGGKK